MIIKKKRIIIMRQKWDKLKNKKKVINRTNYKIRMKLLKINNKSKNPKSKFKIMINRPRKNYLKKKILE